MDEVARFCQPAFCVNGLFDEPWDPDHVYFIVTAKELVEDASAIEAAEERDYMHELPLHIVHCRESRASTPLPRS